MDRLRICYIGAGRFTNRRNFPHLAEHNVDLVAVCDLEEEKARKAQEEYGFGKVYTDFREMLEKEKPDAVFCVGPHRMHYGVGKEVLEMGFPLYTQKPPAANGQMAQEMADIARREGVVAHTGFTLRFSKAFRDMKRVMESGTFGRPTLCIVRYMVRTGSDLRAAAIDMNSHAVDAGRFFMGDIEELKVEGGRQEGVRSYVATASFKSGAVGTFNFSSGMMGGEIMDVQIVGEEGHVLTDRRYKAPGKPEERIGVLEAGQGPHHASGSWWDVENYLNAVRGAEEDISPIQSAARTMQDVDVIIAQLEEMGAAL